MQAGISIGANLGDARASVLQAVGAIAGLPETMLTAQSSLYRTEPWGDVAQDWFINAACLVETRLPPHDLLRAAQAIEIAMGRSRRDNAGQKGPRLIDVDIIFYGGLMVQTSTLTLPHQHYASRRFVLEPLLEIAPDLKIAGTPVRETIAALAGDPLAVIQDAQG